MALNICPVILCGGSGTRLWPLSRVGYPKQFLALSGKETLFQQAILRLHSVQTSSEKMLETVIVTNEENRFLALDQLRELPQVKAQLLLEPVGRNTAPALTIAALQAMEGGVDPVLVVTPADQTVADQEVFIDVVKRAVRVADTGAIVVLGVKPAHPETGYGYIRKKGSPGVHGEFDVAEFVEKPNQARAIEYLSSSDYLWNAGIFVLRASTWLNALKKYRPDISSATRIAWQSRSCDGVFIRTDKNLFDAIPSESIDYAVIEKCSDSEAPIKMIPLKAGWSDLGAWDAVWKAGIPNQDGNVILSEHGSVLVTDTENSLIYAGYRMVASVGLKNIVIVETPDAVLVAEKNQSQEVKAIISQLKSADRQEHILHRKVHRPWGWYDSIDESDRFKVKRIQVKPGASLSLQKHRQRAEHWVVVKGVAEVTNGDEVITLHENQSTYIPIGQVHRLSNPGTEPLEIIEVQSGFYLGEDDIERLEDGYGRASS